MRKNVAIIGGGIAGLTAGYLLSWRHNVTLFEKSGRLGGNAYSHRTPDGQIPDIAAAAFGKAGYKNFYALLKELGIQTQPALNTYASFHNLDTGDGIYLTPNLQGILAQKLRHFSPHNLWSLVRLLIGMGHGRQLLKLGGLKALSMEQLLNEIPEMTGDSRLMFICALCLLSSMEASEVLAAPAQFFFDKLQVHHDVISPKFLYSIHTVKGGTRAYVSALSATFREGIVLNADIRGVLRGESSAALVMGDGGKRVFDKVVFACNPDQALKLLDSPTPEEKKLLGAWRCKDGRVVVHKDYSAFPRRELVEAYTFLYQQKPKGLDISVNGALWKQPHISKDCLYISSQHPNFPIKKELTDLEVVLRTPIFDRASTATTALLPGLNNVKNAFYCGSYFGYGLHEDAVTSAMAVAKILS